MDNKKHLDLRLLEQFLVVCDTLSMTLAAERLRMSVPAVSQLVVRLERELGIVLFERNRYGLRLTPAAAELRDRARLLLANEDEALDSLQGYRDCLIPQLRLHVLQSVATTLIPAIVAEFTDHVGTLNVKSGANATYLKEFLTGDLDMLISSDELSDVPGIEQYLLYEESLVGIVPVTIPPQQRRPDYLAGKLSFVRFMRGHGRQQIIENYLADIELDPPHDIECSSPGPILELVSRGLGWTIATPFSVEYLEPLADKIAWMPLPGPVPSRKIYLLTHAGRYLDLPRHLAQQCCLALQATVDAWSRALGNEALVSAVRVAPAAGSVAARPVPGLHNARLRVAK